MILAGNGGENKETNLRGVENWIWNWRHLGCKSKNHQNHPICSSKTNFLGNNTNSYFFLLQLIIFTNTAYDIKHNTIILNILFRIKNNGSETPTSISVDFFSGYHFVSLSNSDNTKEFWHVTNINHNLVLHVNKVSYSCLHITYT